MSSPPSDQWGMPDAWLLAAIATARPDPAGDGATLAEVLSAAEGINHATPTREEAELAIRRLLGTGLIAVDDTADHFRLTEAGQQVRRRWRHGLFGWIDALPPALRRHGSPQPAEWSLPPDVYEQAIEQALQTWWKAAVRHSPSMRRHGPVHPAELGGSWPPGSYQQALRAYERARKAYEQALQAYEQERQARRKSAKRRS
jgi:hypothetical protein